MRNQIPAGLNFTLTGNPNFNSDIGGFFAGNYNKSWNDGSAPKNPMYQELYVRWLQFGTFTPMMRSHGADTPREIYQFGKKANQYMMLLKNDSSALCIVALHLFHFMGSDRATVELYACVGDGLCC